MFNKDCFAYVENNEKRFCSALDHNYVRNCDNCKFYRNDITSKEIEQQIEVYRLRNKG